MKICIVSREIYPYIKAGIAVYSYNLCRLLAQQGHEVTLLTDDYEGIAQHPDFSNIHVVPVKSSHPIDIEIFSNFNLYYSYQVYTTLMDLTQQMTFDLIEAPDYFGEIYFTLQEKQTRGFLAQTPIVVKCHTPLYECLNATQTNLLPYQDVINQENYIIQHADALCTISDSLAQSLTNRLSLLKPFKILLNPLGLHTVESSSYQRGDSKKIVFVGKLQPLKGVDLLIQASLHNLEKGLKFQTILIGLSVDGEKERLLQMIPDKYRQHFEFMGFLPREEIFKQLKTAYFSAFPSRWEGLGNVWIEAVTQGSPVILSDAGGLTEMKKYGEFGCYFKNGDVLELSHQMYQLLTNEELRDTYAQNCSQHARVFLDDSIYQQQLQFYHDIVESKITIHQSKTIEMLMHENFMHTVRLSQELHQEVLRLNGEIKSLHEDWQRLNQQHELLIQEYGQLKSSAESKAQLLTSLATASRSSID